MELVLVRCTKDTAATKETMLPRGSHSLRHTTVNLLALLLSKL